MSGRTKKREKVGMRLNDMQCTTYLYKIVKEQMYSIKKRVGFKAIH